MEAAESGTLPSGEIGAGDRRAIVARGNEMEFPRGSFGIRGNGGKAWYAIFREPNGQIREFFPTRRRRDRTVPALGCLQESIRSVCQHVGLARQRYGVDGTAPARQSFGPDAEAARPLQGVCGVPHVVGDRDRFTGFHQATEFARSDDRNVGRGDGFPFNYRTGARRPSGAAAEIGVSDRGVFTAERDGLTGEGESGFRCRHGVVGPAAAATSGDRERQPSRTDSPAGKFTRIGRIRLHCVACVK
jgi:hypothetical protein